jgi:hypothetical protein
MCSLFFSNESSHKMHLNIEILRIFFSLMINMRIFFDFSIILLCFMVLICIHVKKIKCM